MCILSRGQNEILICILLIGQENILCEYRLWSKKLMINESMHKWKGNKIIWEGICFRGRNLSCES